MNTIGKNIHTLRKQNGLTQEELAGKIGVTYQAVSKWENGTTAPDIALLPELAVVLGTSIDALLGYAAEKKTSAWYEERYKGTEYYWGVKPSFMCLEVLRILPPDRPLKVLDAGCGEGKDAVFFAKNGYKVSAFDITQSGIDKAKRLAERHGVEIDFFRADILDYRLEKEFDVIFCSGVLYYVPERLRGEVLDNWKRHTAAGGVNALNVFVEKPFIPKPPDHDAGLRQNWRSGELFGYYYDWRFERCEEVIFDCNSSGVPHKHCMDTLIAVKESGMQL